MPLSLGARTRRPRRPEPEPPPQLRLVPRIPPEEIEALQVAGADVQWLRRRAERAEKTLAQALTELRRRREEGDKRVTAEWIASLQLELRGHMVTLQRCCLAWAAEAATGAG